ncbi:MAG: GxxExxY protein [Nostocaceae cyanobacterium]|nr:GxxExxY protein [Nostocaceae cyanobacterium]
MYETALAYELERRGLRVVRQQPIPVVYECERKAPEFNSGDISGRMNLFIRDEGH